MITFSYGLEVLSLRNPNLGDSRKHNIQLNYGVAMDGKVYTYKRTPSYSVLLLTFVGITKSKAEEAMAFFKEQSGNEITYVDQDGVNWVGRIITEPIEFKTVRSIPTIGSTGDECVETYTFTVEFSCAKV